MEKAVLPSANDQSRGVKRPFYLQIMFWNFFARDINIGIKAASNEILCEENICFGHKVPVGIGGNAEMASTEPYSYPTIVLHLFMFNMTVLMSHIVRHAKTMATGVKRVIETGYLCRYLISDRHVNKCTLFRYNRNTGCANGKHFSKINEKSKKLSALFSTRHYKMRSALFDIISFPVALPVIGVHFDENNTKAIGKRNRQGVLHLGCECFSAFSKCLSPRRKNWQIHMILLL